MELEESTIEFTPAPDKRPPIPEPPPVRLVAVSDVRMPAPAGRERDLDAFYVTLLEFARDPDEMFPVYWAENFCLRFDVHEPPLSRDDLRPTGIQVRSLAALEQKLIDDQRDYTRQRGLLPGTESLLLTDPAGNWIEIAEFAEVR